ncbi:MAG: GGDEF domain-containing protein [Endomicrobiales bacterium]|nr:GGDEF domain-containing protein [Endomicrobiales bacterium]
MVNTFRPIKQKILSYVKVAFFLSLFFALYFSIPEQEIRRLSIYILVLINIYFAFALPEAAIFINSIGLILLFKTHSFEHLGIILGLIIILIVTVIIPFYFAWFKKWELGNFRKLRVPKMKKIDALQKNLNKIEERRQELEKEIGKINRLYVLGRELVEHMNISEVIDNLQRVLLNRPGVKSVSIFQWKESDWEPLYFSRIQHKDKWLSYIRSNKSIFMGKRFSLLPDPPWIADESAVFWPVQLEKELLAGIILTTEKDLASSYLEEGEIFIPLIALGLRRTSLFAEVQERSRIDGLTGLYLRRYFLELFQVEIQRAKRYSSVFSVLMVDIDFFKKVNDTYGHLVGDEVLRILSKIIVKCIPPSALIGRYGGEEFIMLLPLSSPGEALKIAKNLNSIVADHDFIVNNISIKISISLGISHYPQDGVTVKELLFASDQALYWVKTHGRNSVKEFRKI